VGFEWIGVLNSFTYPLNVTALGAIAAALGRGEGYEGDGRGEESAIAATRPADRKRALRQFARTMTMKRRETSRGDLTDKLRGMMVKRMREAEP